MNHGLFPAGKALAARLARSIVATLRQHPRRITAALATVMLGTGATAFAVATLAPQASDLTVRQVLHEVQPLAIEAQTQALQTHDYSLYRSELTRGSDSADSLLARLGIDDDAAAGFLRRDSAVQQNLMGRAGRSVTAEADARQRLVRLTARWAIDDDRRFKRLVVERAADGGFTSRIELAPLAASARLASGVIQTSLFAATDDARLPDSVALQIAEIFAGDIDFHRSLRKGDRFSITYEALEADGEPLRSGRVLSAEFVNNGKTYQAMWFQEPGQKGSYYTMDGESLRRAYLASPLQFSRVTSGFKMRFHPILQTWRAHLGVDYAAPTGTPVRSVGDGTVEVAGWQNGYGNIVIVRHRNGHTTAYAHLSKIHVRKGQGIEQGQTVGLVGATGWATGPHLHFEFRVNGQHRDPLTIARQSESIPISSAARPAFERAAAGVRLQLAAAALVSQASAE